MANYPKCLKCESRPAVWFAFNNGKPVYACNRHWRTITIDPITDWFRVGKVKEVAHGPTRQP